MFWGLDHALQDMAGKNVFEELELCIKLSGTYDPAGCMNSGNLDLDRVLTEHGAFPKLRKVYLELRWQLYRYPDEVLSNDSDPVYLMPDKVMRELFPRLCGDLAFGFSFHQVEENGAVVDLF